MLRFHNRLHPVSVLAGVGGVSAVVLSGSGVSDGGTLLEFLLKW